MSNQEPFPKPATAEQESGQGLDETTCCASFTPGPWQITRSDHSDHVDVWQASGIGHIAAVSTGIGPDKTAQSNARLIAAAPELLEAMMVIEERYIDGCDTYEDWKFMGDTARAALRFLHNVE